MQVALFESRADLSPLVEPPNRCSKYQHAYEGYAVEVLSPKCVEL